MEHAPAPPERLRRREGARARVLPIFLCMDPAKKTCGMGSFQRLARANDNNILLLSLRPVHPRVVGSARGLPGRSSHKTEGRLGRFRSRPLIKRCAQDGRDPGSRPQPPTDSLWMHLNPPCQGGICCSRPQARVISPHAAKQYARSAFQSLFGGWTDPELNSYG